MARVRYLGPQQATVPELGDRTVEPDEIIEVPDERFEGYACQPANWEVVEEPVAEERAEEPKESPAAVPPTALVKKTAARPQKED